MHVCNQVALSVPEYSDVDDDSESSASRPVEKGKLRNNQCIFESKISTKPGRGRPAC